MIPITPDPKGQGWDRRILAKGVSVTPDPWHEISVPPDPKGQGRDRRILAKGVSITPDPRHEISVSPDPKGQGRDRQILAKGVSVTPDPWHEISVSPDPYGVRLQGIGTKNLRHARPRGGKRRTTNHRAGLSSLQSRPVPPGYRRDSAIRKWNCPCC